MAIDMSQVKHPGDTVAAQECIFHEVGPRGGRTKNYIALPRGRALPETQKTGNLWLPVSIHDIHAGLS